MSEIIDLERQLERFFQWEQATHDTIDVKKIYVDMADDLVAGILLSQIVYWFLPSKKGGTKLRIEREGHLWLAKERSDWWDECRIGPRSYDRASKLLQDAGLIETKKFKFNGLPTIHIRIEWSKFLQLFQQMLATNQYGVNKDISGEETQLHDIIKSILNAGQSQVAAGNNESVIPESRIGETGSAGRENGNNETVIPELRNGNSRITKPLNGNNETVNPELQNGESGITEPLNVNTQTVKQESPNGNSRITESVIPLTENLSENPSEILGTSKSLKEEEEEELRSRASQNLYEKFPEYIKIIDDIISLGMNELPKELVVFLKLCRDYHFSESIAFDMYIARGHDFYDVDEDFLNTVLKTFWRKLKDGSINFDAISWFKKTWDSRKQIYDQRQM